MRKLVVFNMVSLDGYFVDKYGDMSWAHRENTDTEWNFFVEGNAKAGGMLLFGRITYELMASYWPTPLALENNPVVAEQMNNLPKVVFSRTLEEALWNNTTLVNSEMYSTIRNMKQQAGVDMVIMGSGNIVAQLAQQGLIDEYQFVVIPVVLGCGRTLFDGIERPLSFRLKSSRIFSNGNVLLCYVEKR